MLLHYNFITFPTDFPIHISLKKVTNQESDWHTKVKILYILEGSATLKLQNQTFTLCPDEIILINPWTTYDIFAEAEIAYLELDIDFIKFDLSTTEIDKLFFELNSVNDLDKEKYSVIKAVIFSLIQVNTMQNAYITYINKSLAYQLLFTLMNQFKVESNVRKAISQKHFIKLKEILNYIEKNYMFSPTLNDVASHFGYTPQYFSAFFNKQMNQNYQTYLDTLRINKNFHLLHNSDITLEDIAQASGFSDYRSYIRAFKNIYFMTPSEFRRNKNEKPAGLSFSATDVNHYLDIIYKNKICNLEEITSKIDQNIEISIDFEKKGEKIHKTFLNMIGVNRASDLLRQNVRTMLEQAQKEIGFKMIKFQGLFSDELHVYRKFVNGEKSISFVFIDQIFDYIKSINLKPFIQLSYMPRDMAKDKNKIVFESKFIASEPELLEDWLLLVQTFITHMIQKYGLDEVLSWPLTIWHEPDSSVHAFGFKSDDIFFEFYRKTYNIIKEISPKFRIGTPNLIPFASWAMDWDKRFLKYTQQMGCYPDFLNVTYYSNDFDFFITGKKLEKLSKNPDNLKDYIKKLRDPKFYKGNTIYLSEWSITTNQRNLINDTIFASCYLTKNILENMDSLDSFTKWGLTDFIDQTQLPNQTYHGGSGLFTYNGICKAQYSALKFLSRLDEYVIETGDGYYITKGRETIKIIIYNYLHYSDLFANGEYFSIKSHSRYEPFQMNMTKKYSFHFENINYIHAKIKVSRITQESGSSYDIYESMSNLEFENIDETADLKKLSTPKYILFDRHIENNMLDISASVQALEVKLIEIRFFKNKPL
jgi:Bacterial regulatory helix-turn-helix proteins, AraC family./Glycosyl hydrolases family 39.